MCKKRFAILSTAAVIFTEAMCRAVSVVAAVVFVSSFILSQGETVLFEDNFDEENGGQAQLDYFTFQNWDVIQGTVDIIGNGACDFLPGNGLYIDLDGSSSIAGTIETKTAFTLNPGQYQLQFQLAGSQRGDTNTVVVSLGSIFQESITLESSQVFIDMGW